MDIDIHSAIKFNNIAKFKDAVEKDDHLLDARNESGDTVLHTACDFQNAGMVEIILAKRPTMVSSRNRYGETPMHRACKHGNLQILQMLMESDQEVATQVDDRDHNPLMVCIYGHNHYDLVEYLLQYPGMPGSDENGTMCLRIAILKLPEDVKMVRLLVEARPNLVMKRDEERNTAWHIAVSNGCFQVAEYLINHSRVDVDARNIKGNTALDIVNSRLRRTDRIRTVHELVEAYKKQFGDGCSDTAESPVEDFSPSTKFPSHDQQEGQLSRVKSLLDRKREEDKIHLEEEEEEITRGTREDGDLEQHTSKSIYENWDREL